MPTLESQAKAEIRAVASHYKRGPRASSRYPLPMDSDLIILYGTWRGWTDPVIADALRCSTGTVSRRRRVRSLREIEMDQILMGGENRTLRGLTNRFRYLGRGLRQKH